MDSNDGWGCLKVSRSEVDIATVLVGGQSFRWKQLETDPGAWIGVFAHKVWILKQTEESIHFKTFSSDDENGKIQEDENQNRVLLYNYFQLDVSLQKLYSEWSLKDERFAKLTLNDYKGIRILQQDCVENVFSFICSSNNNISRISQMVEKLAMFYGNRIASVNGRDYYDFPEVEALVGEKVEKKLREEKFGYRAGFISKTASKITENGGAPWLENLKNIGYGEARKQLQTLTGIGRKVADCICLMSLGYSEAIPVDTHIHQVAVQYMPHLSKQKSLTDKSYDDITAHFRTLHGRYAGWAQSVLFSSRLKHLGKPQDNETSAGRKRQNVPTDAKNCIPEKTETKTNSKSIKDQNVIKSRPKRKRS